MFIRSLGIALSLFFIGCSGCAHDPKPEPTPVPSPTPTPTPLPPAEITEKTVVNFDFDSVRLSRGQKDLLKKAVAGKALDVPVRVVGHADSQGTAKYNQKLSEERAAAVVKYLQNKLHMKGKISVEGKGETALLNADKTRKEHKQNRRAEVVIIVN
jgi:OOP family OmpA-OmpF porin